MGFAPINTWWSRGSARTITFIAVTFAWAFFRAENLNQVTNLVEGLLGLNGFALPIRWFDKFGPLGPVLESMGIEFIYSGMALHRNAVLGCLMLLFIVLWMPNSQQMMEGYKPALKTFSNNGEKSSKSVFVWRPSLTWAYGIALMDIYVILSMSTVAEFLYWKF